jgi:methyl-accepting chemotaxis protein
VVIAYLASRAIVTPIRKLTDAANRISVGELGVEIKTTSKDEIGDLADAITRMQDSIRLSIERLRRRRR